MKFPRRKRFEFTHPEAKGPAIFKAWSEEKAWKKMRSFVMQTMFGGFALIYDPGALEKVMKQVTCRRLPDSAGETRE